MRRDKHVAALWLSCASIGGCATSAINLAPERPDQAWTPTTTVEGGIVPGVPAIQRSNGSYALPADPAIAGEPPPPLVDPGRVYSLADLIDLAESNNPATRIAWDEARRVALAAGIAKSAYLPNLTATALGGFQGTAGHDSALGLPVVGDRSASGAVAAISLQWLLFDFGERQAVLDAANQASVASNIAFNAAHQQVIYSVTQAFYLHAAAAARLETAKQSLNNAQSIQVAAEERYRHGIGTVIEVDQARQGAAQANLVDVEAIGAAQDAYLNLLGAMGISPLTKIKIADVSGRSLPESPPALAESVIAEALARRPDVQGAYAAEQAKLANARAAEAEFKPKLFLSGNGTYTSGGLNVTALPAIGSQAPTVNINGNRFGGSIFAGIAIPIYDGGLRAAVLAQARAGVDSASAFSARVKEDAVRQIVSAHNALRTSLAAYSAASSLATAAQTTFKAALAAYHSGVGSTIEVTQAEIQLLHAKNASSDAYSTALTAAATLALASGALGSAPQ